MRAAIPIIAILGACTRADSERELPARPAVGPKKVETKLVEELKAADQLDNVDRSAPITCWLRARRTDSEATIPLGEVTWRLEENSEGVAMAIATCTRPKCIHQKSQSHTTGIPHHDWTEHDEVDIAVVVISRAVSDRAAVIAELERARERCAKKP